MFQTTNQKGTVIWVNYNRPPTWIVRPLIFSWTSSWIKAILGWFPLWINDWQWGRSEVVLIYPDVIGYNLQMSCKYGFLCYMVQYCCPKLIPSSRVKSVWIWSQPIFTSNSLTMQKTSHNYFSISATIAETFGSSSVTSSSQLIMICSLRPSSGVNWYLSSSRSFKITIDMYMHVYSPFPPDYTTFRPVGCLIWLWSDAKKLSEEPPL